MVKNGQVPNQIPQVTFDRRKGSSFGVEVIDLDDLRRRSLDHSVFRAHRIEFNILLVITGGCGQHMVDFVLHPAERGTLIHIGPGQVQRFDGGSGEDQLQGFLVLFQSEVSGTLTPSIHGPRCLRPAPADFDLLETLTELIFDLKNRELVTPPDRLAWRMLSTVLELWDGAVQMHTPPDEGSFRRELELFENLLDRDFAEHRDVAWYARALGCSEKTLSRWCRRAFGVNAKGHIDQRVALEAKRLLVHTESSVDRIAGDLGFSEATNFVKFFKRLEGTTPLDFRRLYT